MAYPVFVKTMQHDQWIILYLVWFRSKERRGGIWSLGLLTSHHHRRWQRFHPINATNCRLSEKSRNVILFFSCLIYSIVSLVSVSMPTSAFHYWERAPINNNLLCNYLKQNEKLLSCFRKNTVRREMWSLGFKRRSILDSDIYE